VGLALGLDRAMRRWIAQVPVLSWLAGYPVCRSQKSALAARPAPKARAVRLL
jgi:hypothetical protein